LIDWMFNGTSTQTGQTQFMSFNDLHEAL